MSRIKNFCEKRYYFLLFFGFILLYNYVVTTGFQLWRVDENTYLYHLVDFSMGFCSKFLPGAIYNFIFDNTSIESVSMFCVAVFLIIALFISAMSEKMMLSTDANNKKTLLILLTLFVTGTSVFPMCVYRMGSLDSYWILFSLLSLFFLSDKRLYILIIPATLLSVMVNFGSVISYIPFIILLMIYKTSIIKDKKEKIYLWTVIIGTSVLSLLLFAYFLMYEQDNLKYTFEEFSQILRDRGFQGEAVYYGMNLYEISYYEEVDFDHINSIESPVLSIIVMLFYRVTFTVSRINIEQGIAPLLLALPIVVLIFSYFKKRITDKTDSIIKRLVFLCVVLMFFCTIIFGVILSTDLVRFLGHAYSILFASFLYIAYKEEGDGLEFVRERILKIPKNLVAFYCMCYIFMVFDPMGLIE